MAQQTTVLFEHRHTHDQAFLRSFYWHSLTLSPSYMRLWAGLFAVGMVLAVQSIREGAKGTVSYTHLDVYKRQLPTLISPELAQETIHYADQIYLEFGADTHIEGCLLYTSRCV